MDITPPTDTAETLREAILAKLTHDVGRHRAGAQPRDWFIAAALAVRDRVVDRWLDYTRASYDSGAKQVYYLSMEFLIGRQLGDNASSLGLTAALNAALETLGVDPAAVLACEQDPALGNGGLGRLAACYMESMATLGVPGFGYGIRYEHGLFRQVIRDGWQQEYPEDWLRDGNPWEFHRPEVHYEIGFGGTVAAEATSESELRHVWKPAETVLATAYDTPVVGWRGKYVNTLRLWSADSPQPLKLDAFNHGDHVGALIDRVRREVISKVLYPGDDTPAGQELRLRQEYFFAAAALQDLIRRHLRVYGEIQNLPDKVAIQLNDTHPAIGVAELMRIFMDLHGLTWDEAWDLTRRTFSYTNHTLMPEALESWPVPLMERLLPRHMQIIYMINAFHLDGARAAHPDDARLLRSISLIDETNGRRVRMGHLAFVGSHRVNGVSALHTELLKTTVFADLHALDPGRIVSRTNGITFRRWLFEANPGLTALLVDAIGPRLLDDAEALADLRPLANDAAFCERFAAVKRRNKAALADMIRERLGMRVDPDAMFDVQIKRIHEYKRQLLNILETVALYDAIRSQPTRDWAPRVKILAGKAASSYRRAKLIIKLAHDVARVVNSDPTLRGRLKVAFIPDYNVSRAELIIPAADLSEQISTAGMEASGTGNMKLALNGALTIGTLDGANVEMRDRIGAENMHIFGMTAAEVRAAQREGRRGEEAVARSPVLAEVLEAIASGVFSPDEPGRYGELVEAVRGPDPFMVAADFNACFAEQRHVDARWRDRAAWNRAAVLNTAGTGYFSADRAIAEYASGIWNVPVPR